MLGRAWLNLFFLHLDLNFQARHTLASRQNRPFGANLSIEGRPLGVASRRTASAPSSRLLQRSVASGIYVLKIQIRNLRFRKKQVQPPTQHILFCLDWCYNEEYAADFFSEASDA